MRTHRAAQTLKCAPVGRRAADHEDGQADLRLRRIVQAEGALGNSRDGFAFELKRELFLQVRGVAREIGEAFGAELRAIDEAQPAVAARRGSPH